MGRQDGIIKIKGQLGGISFYKTKHDGYQARQKGGIDPHRLKTDPAFQRTRENGQEFGRAGRASKLMRHALSTLLHHLSDGRMAGRLTRDMLKVIQADTTSVRGKRNVLDGETELLTGFDFNQNAKLANLFGVPFTSAINRATGQVTITLPAYVPASTIDAPPNATHFKLLSAGVAIDFEQAEYEVKEQVSAALALDMQEIAGSTLESQLTGNSTRPMFLVFGIAFYQQVNGVQYPLFNGSNNALAIVHVDGGSAMPSGSTT
jgi:hypothetical protein